MTDKELLELAAKAAGIELRIYDGMIVNPGTDLVVVTKDGFPWNPLNSGADALRLAVKLNLIVDIGGGYAEARCPEFDPEPKAMEYFNNNDDPYAATRRAIVRAASEIGRGME